MKMAVVFCGKNKKMHLSFAYQLQQTKGFMDVYVSTLKF